MPRPLTIQPWFGCAKRRRRSTRTPMRLRAGCSRLTAARFSKGHPAREVSQVGGFDEDDLCCALEYRVAHQRGIETALASGAARGAVFLYAVTSVFFEGKHN